MNLKDVMHALVAIIMGSNSDLPKMVDAVRILKKFGIPYEIKIYSAHRTPDETAVYANKLKHMGVKVIIVGAGWAAHLAGAIASQSILPVVAVPIDSSPIPGGVDALLSTVQMPPGIPVGTQGIDNSYNAGVYAVEILALLFPELEQALLDFRKKMASDVLGKKTEQMLVELEVELAKDKEKEEKKS